jgi:hypothetical protein
MVDIIFLKQANVKILGNDTTNEIGSYKEINRKVNSWNAS